MKRNRTGAWRSTGTVLGRLLLILAIMFWQGGFTFYGSVVVPIGSHILGSHLAQGEITQSITNYLNLAGAVALVLWGVDIGMVRATGLAGRKVRLAVWSLLVLTLGLLAWLHLRLDSLLNVDVFYVLEPEGFHFWHRVYLYISTIQWAGGIVLVGLTLVAWRQVDARDTQAGTT